MFVLNGREWVYLHTLYQVTLSCSSYSSSLIVVVVIICIHYALYKMIGMLIICLFIYVYTRVFVYLF